MSDNPSAIHTPEDLEAQYAGFFSRAIAFIVDILIINVSVILTSALVMMIFNFFQSAVSFIPGDIGHWIGDVSVPAVDVTTVIILFIMAWLYPVIFWMMNGQTVGKRIMGLRVVRMDGKKITFFGGLMRMFGYWISAAVLFIGFLWVLFSNERRGWHDMLAGTCVIYSWDARDSATMRKNMRNTKQRLMRQSNETPQTGQQS